MLKFGAHTCPRAEGDVAVGELKLPCDASMSAAPTEDQERYIRDEHEFAGADAERGTILAEGIELGRRYSRQDGGLERRRRARATAHQ